MHTETQLCKQITQWAVEVIQDIERTWPDFPMPTVSFDVTGRVAGIAYLDENRVSFNLAIAAANMDKFKNTVIHELAHLVVDKYYPMARQAHGKEFRWVCQHLGGTGSAKAVGYAAAPNPAARSVQRWIADCGCGTHYIRKSFRDQLLNPRAALACVHCRQRVKLRSTDSVKRKSDQPGYEAK